MPGYASIVNYLLRLFPDDAGAALYKAAVKLSPQAENLADPALTQATLREELRVWHTRAAVEALRGWKWPFWINRQLNPADSGFVSAAFQSSLRNTASRDAAIIPGIPGRFSGTMDRRGMVTPVGARFSLECWFRINGVMVYPGELLEEAGMSFGMTDDGFKFTFPAADHTCFITATAKAVDDFEFLKINAGMTFSEGVEWDSNLSVVIYVAVRPYNLENVIPIHDLVYNSKGFWMSENRIIGGFALKPDISWASDARHGDSALFLSAPPERTAVTCPAGMATAVSAFHFPATEKDEGQRPVKVEIIIPLKPAYPREFPFAQLGASSGRAGKIVLPFSLQAEESNTQSFPTAKYTLKEDTLRQLKGSIDVTSQDVKHMLLHRNSCLVAAVRALLLHNERQAAARLLSYCAFGFQKNGYLPAGHNKWFFQGQFLTALADYYRISGSAADETILRYSQIKAAARWIMRKRREVAHAPAKPRGLLPPGLTRDGIGTEFQLADNLWTLEGLEAAKDLARLFDEHTDADIFHNDAVKYAAQISAAIHRELEYGITQQVPGRLHRAFDAAGAADLLDIALTDEARTLLKPLDWLPRLINTLAEETQASSNSHNIIELLRMDERGLKPARRLMLHLAHHIVHGGWRADFDNLHKLVTPMGAWTECLHPHTRSGCGRQFHDPEASALFLILMQSTDKTESAANNRET